VASTPLKSTVWTWDLLLRACGGQERRAAPRDAALLAVVVRWSKHRKIWHGGELWIARRRDSLAHEAGLSFDQTKRALASLKRLQLIETSQHLYGRNMAILHVRPTAKCTTPVTATAPPHIKKKYKRKKKKTKKRTSFAEAEMKVEEILQEEEISREDLVDIVLRDKPEEAAILWKKAAVYCHEIFVSEMSVKNRTQLKNLHKALPANSSQILLKVIEEWPKFNKHVIAETADKRKVAKPDIGYALFHKDQIVTFYLADAKKQEPKVATGVSWDLLEED